MSRTSQSRLSEMTNLVVFIALWSVLSVPLSAQTLTHVQGELLVQLKEGTPAESFTKSWNERFAREMAVDKMEAVVKRKRIFKLKFNFAEVHEQAIMEALHHNPDVLMVQRNQLIQARNRPNDPLYSAQWQYSNDGSRPSAVAGADIAAEAAWQITTGGVTALGDTIIVCVIDDGIAPGHPDFVENMWLNHNEIPNNNIDDDNNGYVDDYYGWDIWDNDGDPRSTLNADWHGTPVAGIVGATGNNGIGVTGVSWHVKVMVVRGFGSAAQAISAYEYPLMMRQLYNETDGERGAFVVATNASWGQDNGMPSDAPMWCALYDELGQAGILNACATTNSNDDVDVEGDLPTTCPSEYIISVTNIGDDGLRHVPSGYGAVNIDMGASGEGSYTLDADGGYDPFGGTSAAAPHVAGAIGLLYAAPCEAIAQLAKADPSAAAMAISNSILENLRPNADLVGDTKYEGVLHLGNAMNALVESCDGCTPPINPSISSVGRSSAQITFSSFNDDADIEIQYRALGSTSWTSFTASQSPVLLPNLLHCQTYELRLRSFCTSDMTNSSFSPVIAFKTDGCCDVPAALSVLNVGTTEAVLSWEDVTASTSFSAVITDLDNSTSTDVQSTNNSLQLTSLLPCTNYEVAMTTICGDSSSAAASIVTFKTLGCGACLDSEYCSTPAGDTEFEYIDRVGIRDVFEHVSGDNQGYGDFTSTVSITINRGNDYDFILQAGQPDPSVDIFDDLMVWLDWDQSGTFSDDEVIAESPIRSANPVTMPFAVPEDAALGSTRMRVALRFNNSPDACRSNASEEISGEYEDYCVQIDRGTNVQDIEEGLQYKLYPNPVAHQLYIQVQSGADRDVRLRLHDSQGRLARDPTSLLSGQTQHSIEMSSLPAGIYLASLVDASGKVVHIERIVKL